MSNSKEFFNLNDLNQGIHRQLAPGIDTRIFTGQQAMLSVVTLAPNAQGSIHSHPQEQWGVLLNGDGIRIQDGQEFAVCAGDFWRTPGGVTHGIRAGAQGARILDIFSPPREEYTKPGSGFAAESR